MDGDVGVEAEGFDVAADQLLDRPGRHRLWPEAVPAVAAYRFLGPEEGGGGIVADAGEGKPGGQFLNRLQVQWRRPLLVALAGNVEDAVLAIGAEVPHPELDQLADAASGIAQHGEQGAVADAD